MNSFNNGRRLAAQSAILMVVTFVVLLALPNRELQGQTAIPKILRLEKKSLAVVLQFHLDTGEFKVSKAIVGNKRGARRALKIAMTYNKELLRMAKITHLIVLEGDLSENQLLHPLIQNFPKPNGTRILFVNDGKVMINGEIVDVQSILRTP